MHRITARALVGMFALCGASLGCKNGKDDEIPASVARERAKQVKSATFSYCQIASGEGSCVPSSTARELKVPVEKILATVAIETVVLDASVIFKFVKAQGDGSVVDVVTSGKMPVKGSPAEVRYTFEIPKNAPLDPQGNYLIGFSIIDNENGVEHSGGRVAAVTIR